MHSAAQTDNENITIIDEPMSQLGMIYEDEDYNNRSNTVTQTQKSNTLLQPIPESDDSCENLESAF